MNIHINGLSGPVSVLSRNAEGFLCLTTNKHKNVIISNGNKISVTTLPNGYFVAMIDYGETGIKTAMLLDDEGYGDPACSTFGVIPSDMSEGEKEYEILRCSPIGELGADDETKEQIHRSVLEGRISILKKGGFSPDYSVSDRESDLLILEGELY